MSISIEPLADIDRWNYFVASCPTHTFLHSWQWGQVQLQMGEPVQYLGFYRQHQLIGVALVITVKARRGWHYLVPHGPLGQDEETIRQLIPPLVYAKQPAVTLLPFALRHYYLPLRRLNHFLPVITLSPPPCMCMPNRPGS
jgi:lipid II:glycine glycyltransferase (peptidoglycan interpeptide bridge formation enzyme)